MDKKKIEDTIQKILKDNSMDLYMTVTEKNNLEKDLLTFVMEKMSEARAEMKDESFGSLFSQVKKEAIPKKGIFESIADFLAMHEVTDPPNENNLKLSCRLLMEELLEFTMELGYDVAGEMLERYRDVIDEASDELVAQKEELTDIPEGEVVDPAIGDYNKQNAFKELIDLLYVLGNAAYHCGFHGKMEDGFQVVHKNNMKKLKLSSKQIVDLLAVHSDIGFKNITLDDGTELTFAQDSGGKIIKPLDHKKDDVRSVLHKD